MMQKLVIKEQLRHRPTEIALVVWLLTMAWISQIMSAMAIQYGLIMDTVFLIIWLMAGIGILLNKKWGFITGLAACGANIYGFSVLFIAMTIAMIQGINKAPYVVVMVYIPFVLAATNLLFCVKFIVYCYKIFSGRLKKLDQIMTGTLKWFPIIAISFGSFSFLTQHL